MSEWQPIETAPRDGTIILLVDGGNQVWGPYAGAWVGKNDHYPWVFLDPDIELNGMPPSGFTHWMPLPEPPQ